MDSEVWIADKRVRLACSQAVHRWRRALGLEERSITLSTVELINTYPSCACAWILAQNLWRAKMLMNWCGHREAALDDHEMCWRPSAVSARVRHMVRAQKISCFWRCERRWKSSSDCLSVWVNENLTLHKDESILGLDGLMRDAICWWDTSNWYWCVMLILSSSHVSSKITSKMSRLAGGII